jgi:hypothetical protein
VSGGWTADYPAASNFIGKIAVPISTLAAGPTGIRAGSAIRPSTEGSRRHKRCKRPTRPARRSFGRVSTVP